jgi:lipopolysaccharide/colanic/teichoic acid biosynthesis glycosyltransferase
LDIAVAIVFGSLALPVLGIVAIVIVLTSGRPVLYRQERIGLHESPFTLLKFRTMSNTRSDQSELVSDAERVTPFGAILRRTSLDEFPQLWNVIRGDMSLVGPRPLLALHLPLYSPEQRRRHLVRPGLTGLAQIAGRRELTFSQRFALDVEYVDTWTLRGDMAILFRTAAKVLLRAGASSPEQQLVEVDDIGLEEAVRKHGA